MITNLNVRTITIPTNRIGVRDGEDTLIDFDLTYACGHTWPRQTGTGMTGKDEATILIEAEAQAKGACYACHRKTKIAARQAAA